MTLKLRATVTEITGGQLKYIRTFKPNVNENGFNIDFEDINFEDNREKCSHIEIVNTGSKVCMIAFDTMATLIDYEDLSTFNLEISPNEYKILDGEADSISMRTYPGKSTTLKVLVW